MTPPAQALRSVCQQNRTPGMLQGSRRRLGEGSGVGAGVFVGAEGQALDLALTWKLASSHHAHNAVPST